MGSGVSVTIPPEFAGLSEETQPELTTAFLSLKNEGKGDEEALQLIMSKQQQQQQPPIKQILLTELLDTINDIVSRGKTPLIIDDSEDDKVNTFYRYRTVQLIDGKKMGLDKSMKNIPVPTIMEEARVRLVAALKYGNYTSFYSCSFLTLVQPSSCSLSCLLLISSAALQVLHSS